MDTGWATARTLRIVANNLFGRQCSDMSPTSTARTRNREKVSASRSCIESDLCDTAASAIIQAVRIGCLPTPRPRCSCATSIMPIQARSSPYAIVVTVAIRLPAQDVAKPAWTKSQSRFQSLSVWFTVSFLRVAMQRHFCRISSATVSARARLFKFCHPFYQLLGHFHTYKSSRER